jgi:hypothetical protein
VQVDAEICYCKLYIIWLNSTNNLKIEECRVLGYVAVRLVLRTEVSEESIVSTIRVTRIGELGALVATMMTSQTTSSQPPS